MFTWDRDLLIFGLTMPDLRGMFAIGQFVLHPRRDVGKYLAGYPDDDVEHVVASGAVLGTYAGASPSDDDWGLPPWDEVLLPLRLWKPGWMVAIPVLQAVHSEGMTAYSELRLPWAQTWAEPMTYTLLKKDLNAIRHIRHQLDVIPMKRFAVALRRFSRSYDYSFTDKVDDCWVDLVIALESITSRGGEGIGQSMAFRTALLLGHTIDERKNIEKKIKGFYDHRSRIVHGDLGNDKLDEQRFMNLEDLRSFVRNTIKMTMSLFPNDAFAQAKTLGEAIDLFLYKEVQHSRQKDTRDLNSR